MATLLLRRSGNLARYSRGIAENAARLRYPSSRLRPQSQLSAFINTQRCRTYATTNQGDPKPPNNGKGSDGENNNKGNDNGSKKPKYVLSEKEIEELNRVAQQLKNNLPPSQGKVIDEAVELLKKEGLPEEVKSLMKEMKSGKPLSLASAATFVRVFAKQTWRAAGSLAEKEVEQEMEKEGRKTPQESQSQQSRKPEESEETKSSSDQKQQQGQQRQQQQKKQNGEQESQSRPQFNVFGMKVDVGNFIVASVISYYVYRSINPGETTKDITWQEFRTTFFDKGLVEKLTVFNRNRVRVELH